MDYEGYVPEPSIQRRWSRRICFSSVLFFLFFQVALNAEAQKVDIIHKKDSSRLRAYVIGVKNRVVTYRLKPGTKGVLQRIPVAQIAYIQYGNGKKQVYAIEQIQIKPLLLPVEIKEIKALEQLPWFRTFPVPDKFAAGLSPSLNQSNPSEAKPENKSKIFNKLIYRYTSHSIGIDGLGLLSKLSPQWADPKSGLGLTNTLGGSGRFSKRLSKSVGFFLETGYSQWTSLHTIRQKPDTLYTLSTTLRRIPIRVGAKLYLGTQFYVMGMGDIEGIQLLQKSRNAGSNIYVNKSLGLLGGVSAGLGYEVRIGQKLEAGISLTYTYLPKTIIKLTNNAEMTDPIHLVGVWLSVGMRSFNSL